MQLNKASLDQEYQRLSTILSRDDIPEGVRDSLASARSKLDTLYQELSAQYAEHGDWARDAAMGLVQVERITHPLDQPEELYGVDTPVFSVIRLRFYAAEVNVKTGEIRPLDTLAEVRMPESEWGAAIANPNSGHGASTLIEWNGESVASYDPEKDPTRRIGAQMAESMHRTIDNQHAALRQHLDATLATLKDKKRLGKKEADSAVHSMGCNFDNLPANLGFRAEQLIKLADQRSMALANEINLRSKGEA